MPANLQPIINSLQSIGNNPNFFLAAAQDAISVASAPSGPTFLIIKIIFIFISAIFIGIVIYFVLNTNYLKYRILQDVSEFFSFKPYGIKSMVKPWEKILSRLELPDESEHKLAIIEADDVVDGILKRMGHHGANLSERLLHLSHATLPNINDLQQAHVVRNNVVHDPNYRLTLDEAKRTLKIYEKALQDLQALE